MRRTPEQRKAVRVSLPPSRSAPYRLYQFDIPLHERSSGHVLYYYGESLDSTTQQANPLLSSLLAHLFSAGSGVDSIRLDTRTITVHCTSGIPTIATNDLIIRAIRAAGYEAQNMKHRALHLSTEKGTQSRQAATDTSVAPMVAQVSEQLLEGPVVTQEVVSETNGDASVK